MKQSPSSDVQKLLFQSKSAPIVGSLALLISLALVHFWLQVFLLFAIEIPANGMGMSNICDWQYSLSSHLVLSSYSNAPFLVLFYMTAFLFTFRLWKEKRPSVLLMEFGALNFLFVAGGTGIFIVTAFTIAMVSIIPGSETWRNTLLACQPTGLALPGIISTTLMAMGLAYSQATGWLIKRMANAVPPAKPEEEAEITKGPANINLILGGGILLLLLVVILLHSWLVLFFTYAVQLPERGLWACWGTGCENAVWQSALSHYFAFSPGARYRPCLLVFHIALIVSFFRFRRKEGRVFLPLEIAFLGIIFMLMGTIVFAGVVTGYKIANSPNLTATPVLTGEDGMTVAMPALPQHNFMIRDDTGFVIMGPQDDLQNIFSKIPWEVDGRLRARAGVVASTITSLGLLLSMASGWMNRLIRRLSPRIQKGALSAALLLSGIVLFVELRTFGFYLLW